MSGTLASRKLERLRAPNAASISSGVALVAAAGAAALYVLCARRRREDDDDDDQQENSSTGGGPPAFSLPPDFVGLRLYGAARSPATRRVCVALLAHDARFEVVAVSPAQRRSPRFRVLCGAVPTLAYREALGAPLLLLDDAEAICAWLDETFGGKEASTTTTTTNATGSSDVLQVRQWLQWERCVGEAFDALTRAQVDGPLSRFFSGENTAVDDVVDESSSRAEDFGTRRQLVARILDALNSLEAKLAQNDSPFLVGDAVTAADAAVYARLVLQGPLNGILATPRQRAAFPAIVAYVERLRTTEPLLAPFRDDDASWWSTSTHVLVAVLADYCDRGGCFCWGPGAVVHTQGHGHPPWWSWLVVSAKCLMLCEGCSWSWPIIVAVGNLRTWRQACHKEKKGWWFRRCTQDDVALCVPRTTPDDAAHRTSESSVFYYDVADALCCAVRLALNDTTVFDTARRVDDSRTDPALLRVSPFGELPALTWHEDTAYYGASVVLEALGRTPLGPLDRRWLAWARAAWLEELAPIKHRIDRLLDHQAASLFESTKAAGSKTTALGMSIEDDAALTRAVRPFAETLWRQRVSAVDAALRQRRLFLVADDVRTADCAALPVVALAAVHASRRLFTASSTRSRFLDEDAEEEERWWWLEALETAYPRVAAWAASVLDTLSEDAAVALLDLVLAHDAPTEEAPTLDVVADGATASRELIRGPQYATICGVPHSPFNRYDVHHVLRATFKPRPTDVFVATYPKSGTTWAQAIVLMLLNAGDASKVPPHPALQRAAPWLEASYLRSPRFGGPCPLHDGLSVQRAWPEHGGRRVFKTHAPRELFLGGAAASVIYIARDAKDVCCSLYRQTRALPPYEYDGSIDEWVELFAAGQVSHGHWRRHLEGWLDDATRRPEKVLYLHFEALKKEPRTSILRIARFLGVSADAGLVDAVLRHSSFEAMKSKALLNTSSETDVYATSRFNAGGHGAWHVDRGGLLTDAHAHRLDEAFDTAHLPEGLLHGAENSMSS